MKDIKIKLINSLIGDKIPVPKYETKGSAGLDLRACIEEKLILRPGKTEMIPMGFAMHLEDEGLAALVIPRSGLGSKHGIVLGNLVGLIDSDYQGELMVSLFNNSENVFNVNPGDRIAQFLLIPVMSIEYNFVEDFKSTKRSSGGFGHSGTS